MGLSIEKPNNYLLRVTCSYFSFEQAFPTAMEAFLKLTEMKHEHNILTYEVVKL